MTRINVVPVQELSNAHLVLEHLELTRVYKLVRKAIARGESPDDPKKPDTYRTGTGHVRFFYPRLGYIQKRELELRAELYERGLPYIKILKDHSDIPSIWFKNYEPTEEALQINRKRIALRTMEYERHITKGYFKLDGD